MRWSPLSISSNEWCQVCCFRRRSEEKIGARGKTKIGAQNAASRGESTIVDARFELARRHSVGRYSLAYLQIAMRAMFILSVWLTSSHILHWSDKIARIVLWRRFVFDMCYFRGESNIDVYDNLLTDIHEILILSTTGFEGFQSAKSVQKYMKYCVYF